jgi:hypothetical protein
LYKFDSKFFKISAHTFSQNLISLLKILLILRFAALRDGVSISTLSSTKTLKTNLSQIIKNTTILLNKADALEVYWKNLCLIATKLSVYFITNFVTKSQVLGLGRAWIVRARAFCRPGYLFSKLGLLLIKKKVMHNVLAQNLGQVGLGPGPHPALFSPRFSNNFYPPFYVVGWLDEFVIKSPKM